MLLEQPKHLNIIFSIVAENVFLVLLVISTLTLYGISVTRLQILITPDFAIMNYKIQGNTF